MQLNRYVSCSPIPDATRELIFNTFPLEAGLVTMTDTPADFLSIDTSFECCNPRNSGNIYYIWWPFTYNTSFVYLSTEDHRQSDGLLPGEVLPSIAVNTFVLPIVTDEYAVKIPTVLIPDADAELILPVTLPVTSPVTPPTRLLLLNSSHITS